MDNRIFRVGEFYTKRPLSFDCRSITSKDLVSQGIDVVVLSGEKVRVDTYRLTLSDGEEVQVQENVVSPA